MPSWAEPEVETRFLPSGPAMLYESLIHVSLWMLLNGLVAMNGFWGPLEASLIGAALTALPLKSGSDGAGTGTETIGNAEALPASTAEVKRATSIPVNDFPLSIRTSYDKRNTHTSLS